MSLSVRGIDFVNKLERNVFIPRFLVSLAMKLYVDICCLPLHRKILHSISRKDIVIDLGANVGLFTKYFAGRSLRVLAFEPDDYAYKKIKKYTRNLKNVELFKEAVFDKSGSLTLYRHKNFSADPNYCQSSTLIATKINVGIQDSMLVPVVDIAEIINGIDGRIKLLKIDVEGAEVPIINRLLDTGLIKRIDHILVERHDNVIPELGIEIELLIKKLHSEGLSSVDFTWH